MSNVNVQKRKNIHIDIRAVQIAKFRHFSSPPRVVAGWLGQGSRKLGIPMYEFRIDPRLGIPTVLPSLTTLRSAGPEIRPGVGARPGN
eukprot:691394-Prorocentrum_minimum.AAC.1